MKINSANKPSDWMDKFIEKNSQTIPSDGIIDGGEPYSDEEMDMVEKDNIYNLIAKCKEKIARLNKITGNKYGFSFSAIDGNIYGFWVWSHDKRYSSNYPEKKVEFFNNDEFVSLCNWIISLPEDESSLVSELGIQ